MGQPRFDRRRFARLAAAALGGLLAGVGADPADDKPKKKDPDKPLLLQEPHVCRGLNTCKNKGKAGKNDCAGQGDCATAKAHTCAGDNECIGLGGCASDPDTPGENKCKFRGGGSVPLYDKKTWEKARGRFEAAMTKAGQQFGPAPEKPKPGKGD